MALIVFNDNGIYCPRADVYIDPWKAVEKALITHGHADHARYGHTVYLTHKDAAPAIQHRIPKAFIQTVEYGEVLVENGVQFSFHPAGHIPGSSQIRVEYKGEVWVISGYYKIEEDGISQAFEAVRCHHFITESTFGMPIYHWPKPSIVHAEIDQWWRDNRENGITSVLCSYSLGKAQRLLHHLNSDIGPIFTAPTTEELNRILRQQGIKLPETTPIQSVRDLKELKGAIIMCPSSFLTEEWQQKLGPISTAFASGWMGVRGKGRMASYDRGFILSDHADWEGLNWAVRQTEAENIYVTHGFKKTLARWLREKGLNAHTVDTLYEGAGEKED